MKIDRSRLKKSTSEVPVECQSLIDKLRGCPNQELLRELKKIDTWTFGKCELYHWIDILDISDTILEGAATRKGTSWVLACDLPENAEEKELLLWVLHFTTLLIEHSFSRHLYSSMEHLVTLLSSCDMHVVLGVLNLLYMFSKRSNFITRLGNGRRQALINRLTYLAESWGGNENGFGLAECSQESPITAFPPSCTSLHFEFYPEGIDSKSGTPKGKNTPNQLVVVLIENIDKQKKTPSQIMDELLEQYKIPVDQQMQLYTHIRLACSFSDWPMRLLSVQARLQALSVLVYSNALADNAHTLLYTGILEELVQLLELQYPYLMEIRAAALRTLTSIIHLDRNPHFPKKPGSRLNMIIDVTGADSYHGFLPALVRTCITTLTSSKEAKSDDAQGPFPLPLATALFSFLYHLASYEAGGEALVSCGMMESLLRVIKWPGRELEHITFVTRAVRVIDLITNIDMQAFQTHGGLSSFINRLEMEVNVCRIEQPFEIIVATPFSDEGQLDEDSGGSTPARDNMSEIALSDTDTYSHYSDDTIPNENSRNYVPPDRPSTSRGRSPSSQDLSASSSPTIFEQTDTPESPPSRFDRGEILDEPASEADVPFGPPTSDPDAPSAFVRVGGCGTLVSYSDTPDSPLTTFDRGEAVATPVSQMPDYSASKTGKTCLPQRAALLKSMLNFLKKAIQDPAFSDSIRHVMEGSLPASLKHIISNAEYYGPSLFLLATDVVTVYVFQEPSLLSSLQDNGLTDVVLHALLVKDVPATREVLGSLPNVFSALCLNARGLASFVTCKPFERLFKVLLSPTYLAAMRRRRSSDPMGDTASNLGNAMDELMRHQPVLKVDATTAIIKLLEELCVLGRDPKYVCWRAQKGVEAAPTLAAGNPSSAPTDAGSSDEEDEDEEEASTSSHPQREDTATEAGTSSTDQKTPIALIDYILNVMKFIDAILSNNSTDDHCNEFVRQDGLGPLLTILSLPNLPVDYPVTTAAQGVACVCKSILNLSFEPQVLRVGLTQLAVVLESLKPLHNPIREPGSSVLLHELATAGNLETAFSSAASTPLLHAMGAAHGYVVMFVHVCRTGQSEIRALSLLNWSCPTGLHVLRCLAELYISLVWESTLLLALCSDDIIPKGCRFGSEDMDKLLPPEVRAESELTASVSLNSDTASNGMTTAMEALTTDPPTDMDVDDSTNAEKSKYGRAVPTAEQLKYIKPLLGASSRLGRALAELFGLLVKICVGSPIRARRGQVIPNLPNVPTPSALAVAATLNELLARGLTFGKLPKTTIPKFKLTFLICSVGFTSPMLFDEKKYPYHLMLHKFVMQGGQSTFYKCIRWALSADGLLEPSEGLEHPDLPDGTGEFLDASLMLLEKMVNPKAILDSPHTMPGPKQLVFDPLAYLLQTHQDAFETIMLMWGKKPLKVYGARMSESMLAILRHILRGEKILAERLNKELMSSADPVAAGPSSSGAATSGVATTRRPPRDAAPPEVNADHLRQLMDMGFSHEHCREALVNCSSLEAATDYLLVTPAATIISTARAELMASAMELDEDFQMVCAIAMSLDDKRGAEKSGRRGGKKGGESPQLKAEQVKEDWETLVKFQAVIETFTETALASCLALLDVLPDTVYRICDLLITISKRNGPVWRDEMLCSLISEIAFNVDYLLCICEGTTSTPCSPPTIVQALIHSNLALKTAGRIHLFTLLFEGPVYMELRIPCAQVVQSSKITGSLVRLLHQAQELLTATGETATPKWMAPLLLLLDLLEKVSVCTKRREQMHRVTDRTWRWFDLTSGKWTAYTLVNNKLINDAYRAGEQAIRINCSRRRYTLQFNQMIQTNEESTNRRPISMSLISRELLEKRSDEREKGKSESMDVEEQTLHEKKVNVVIEGLGADDSKTIVKACVGLLAIPVDKDTLHAVMRVCLRLTRDYENATVFANLGGVKLLLNLSFYSSFTGFLSLTTLIIRHVIEDPTTLRLSMEKVLRAKTVANIPPGYKELLYLLRNTSAAICRDPKVFLDVAHKVLRIDCNLLVRRNEEEDTRLLLKTLPYRQTTGNVIQGEIATTAIYQLLDALVKSYPRRDEETDSAATPTPPSVPAAQYPVPFASVPGAPVVHSAFRTNAGNLLGVPDDGENELERLRKAREEVANGKGTDEEKKRPLLPKSALLKLLAEAVRSYAGIARLITDHVFRAGQSEVVTEDCTALAFLLDRLLPLSENPEDRECSTMARMLIAAIASCNHSPDAQTVLVAEVRCALLRTLNLPESSEKHAQIQLLTGLVSTMVDNCPPTPAAPGSATLKLHQYCNNMNNIVRIILRKGLLTDLARVSHHLDLSSPNMPASLNAALKPLETLSRIVNQPSTVPLVKAKPKTLNETFTVRDPVDDDPSGTSTSEATQAQGEEVLEDVDNSELDISSNPLDSALTDVNPLQEEGEAQTLQNIMEQLLERVPDSGNAMVTLELTNSFGEDANTTMDVDDDRNNESSQTNAPFENDEDTGDIVEESESDSDSNASDDAGEVHDIADEEDEDDEDDDDGEDNEDEEENGSGYDEEELEFFESDEGLFRIPGLDQENEDILMIQYTDTADTPGMGSLVPWSSGSFPLPFGIFEDPYNGNEASDLGTGNITASHPLLMARHQLEIASLTTTRSQRANRQRRYQYLQLNPRNTNPPVILQRLLGPAAGQGLASTAGQTIASSFGDSRVVVMDNGLGIFTQNEEEQIDFVDQSGYLFGPSLAATLNNVPTAHHWWTEEAKLLDGESQPAAATVIASELLPDLEKYRDQELNERKDKRKRAQDSEDPKGKRKDSEEKSEEREVAAMMEVTTATSAGSNPSTLPEPVSEPLVRSVPPLVPIPVRGSFHLPPLLPLFPSDQEHPAAPRAAHGNNNSRRRRRVSEAANRGRILQLMATAANGEEELVNGAHVIRIPFPQEEWAGLVEELGMPPDTIAVVEESSSPPPGEDPAVSATTPPVSVVAGTSWSDTAVPEIPEGVDPSFLAALPEEMREEVIAEQLRLQRIRQRALVESTGDTEHPALTEVNPEFLAALPLSIQEEVLAQQRQEQQRQAAITANPDDPVDTAAFFENLQPSLRQAILADMAESQIAALPPDLAQEAQGLRRDLESRNRQLMQERFFGHVSHNTTFTSILRNSGRGRVGARYAIHTVPQRAQWGAAWNSRPDPLPAQPGEGSNPQATLRLRGRQLLDHEAMSCLLVLLFVDEPKLNTGRLHRVLRNLCYHGQTRDWVIRALISIMAHCNDSHPHDPTLNRRRMATRSQNPNADVSPPSSARGTSPSWLTISLDAALGCHASVFSIARHPGKRGCSKGQDTINIHPQAAPIVFRHTLEVMISLAKSFPRYFLPHKKDVETAGGSPAAAPTSETKKAASRPGRSEQTDFWEMLVKLDSLTSKKGKSVARAHSQSSLGFDELGNPTNFETSAFGQLIKMLSSPVVKRSCLLTDKLLRLLSLISIGLPDCHEYLTRSTAGSEDLAVPQEHLRLAIQVLTSKSCSEEGLEDATALLLNLANCPEPTRELILHLLLQGAMELSDMVKSHVLALLKELKAMNVTMKREEQQPDSSETLAIDRERPNRGLLSDRFTKDNVVVTAPSKLKGGCDLQLPSMATLKSKTSSQAFFLRILKVITQIRESIRLSQKNKKTSAGAAGTSSAAGASNASGSVTNRPPLSQEEVTAAGATMPRYVPQAPRITLHSASVEGASAQAAAMDTTDSSPFDNEDPLSSEPSSPTPDFGSQHADTAMPAVAGDLDAPRPTKDEEEEQPAVTADFAALSEILSLDSLWETLSACLLELADTPDHHAVLVLQPAVEAFFLFHASSSDEPRTYDARDAAMDQAQVRQPFDFDGSDVAPVSPFEPDAEGQQTPEQTPSTLNINWEPVSPSPVNLPPDQQKFLKFAETHRTVLNQILRQSTTHLADGPFAVLVDHTRVLDFDVKRRYFRSELERLDEGIRREELAVHVRRNNVFEDSFRELHRRPADEWKNRFYIVFEGEEGQDAGGLLREWYVIISREIFNPMYALFKTSPGDRVTYMINSTSHCNPNHLCFFKFVGRVIAKAIYDNKLLECYFTRSFYKHILGILVKYTDMETEDFSFYQGLVYLMENHVSTVGYDLTFSTEVQEFGVTEVRDLIPNGRNIFVSEQTKMDYIRLVCQMKMTGAIRKQINAFLEGFYDIIPKRLIAIFNEQELELLISGLPNVDIEDLRGNTEYHKYQPTSLQIQWFWRALRAFDQADRAKFLQFVTGTSKVPLQGFAALEGMNGVQKFQIHRDDRSTDRLPSAHTCFNQLDLPVYETYNKLNIYLQKAIHECSEGFGFA